MGVILDERQSVLQLLRDYKLNKYMLTRPTNLSYLTEENWVQNMIRILESDSWSYDVRIKQWVDKIDTLVKAQWDGGRAIRPDSTCNAPAPFLDSHEFSAHKTSLTIKSPEIVLRVLCPCRNGANFMM